MVLSLYKFARLIGVDKSTAFRMCKRGQLNYIQLGGGDKKGGKIFVYDIEDDEVRKYKIMSKFFKDNNDVEILSTEKGAITLESNSSIVKQGDDFSEKFFENGGGFDDLIPNKKYEEN